MNTRVFVAAAAVLATPALAALPLAPSYEAYFYAGSGPRVNDRLIVNDAPLESGFPGFGMIQFDLSSLTGPVSEIYLNVEKYDGGFFNGSSAEDPVLINLFASSRDLTTVVADDPNDPSLEGNYTDWVASEIGTEVLASTVVGNDGLYAFDLSDAVNALLAQNITTLDLVFKGEQINDDGSFNNPYFATTLNDAGRLAPELSSIAVPAPGALAIAGLAGLMAVGRRR